MLDSKCVDHFHNNNICLSTASVLQMVLTSTTLTEGK